MPRLPSVRIQFGSESLEHLARSSDMVSGIVRLMPSRVLRLSWARSSKSWGPIRGKRKSRIPLQKMPYNSSMPEGSPARIRSTTLGQSGLLAVPRSDICPVSNSIKGLMSFEYRDFDCHQLIRNSRMAVSIRRLVGRITGIACNANNGDMLIVLQGPKSNKSLWS